MVRGLGGMRVDGGVVRVGYGGIRYGRVGWGREALG